MKSLLPLFLLFSVIAVTNPAAADESESDCFARLYRAAKPFEVFFDGHIQRPDADFGQSNDAINLLGSEASPFKVVPLCNGNFVALWGPVERGPSDLKVMVRIFDEKIRNVGSDFRVASGDKVVGIPDIVSLSNGQIVVAWGVERPNSKYKIRAQLFDDTGKPRSNAFDVSDSGVTATLYRLKGGRFAVLWQGSKGPQLRVFEGNGAAVTPEVLVLSRPTAVPHGYVTMDGNINVFLRNSYDSTGILRYPLQEARSYDANGNPLTDLLNFQDAKKLPGHHDVVESFLEREAYLLDIQLRGYLQGSSPINCNSNDLINQSVVTAFGAKMATTNPRMQRFFVKYCERIRERCSLLERRNKEHMGCLSNSA